MRAQPQTSEQSSYLLYDEHISSYTDAYAAQNLECGLWMEIAIRDLLGKSNQSAWYIMLEAEEE